MAATNMAAPITAPGACPAAGGVASPDPASLEPRPFACPLCPKRFGARAGLRKHQRRHGPAPSPQAPPTPGPAPAGTA